MRRLADQRDGYGPIHRHYVTHAPELHLGRHGGQLTRLIPELAETVPGLADPLRSDPETERYGLPTSAAGTRDPGAGCANRHTRRPERCDAGPPAELPDGRLTTLRDQLAIVGQMLLVVSGCIAVSADTTRR